MHRTHRKMKAKLAIFDFDSTLSDKPYNPPELDWQMHMGVGHLFPEGKLPEELQRIRIEKGKLCTVPI